MNSFLLKFLFSTLCFVASVMLLVAYKVQLSPWEIPWFGTNGIPSYAWLVVTENYVQVVALGLVALNSLWLWLRLSNSDKAAFDEHDTVAGSLGSGNDKDAAPGEHHERSTVTPVAADTANSRRTASQTAPGKQLGAQLQIATAEVSRLKKELVQVRQQLTSVEKNRSGFLADLSHEFRTPMNSIVGMADLLSNTDLPERERRFVNSISTSADSLMNVINAMLDFSRLEQGGLNLENSRFNLRHCVEEVCSSLVPMSNDKGIELLCYVNDDIPAQLDGDVSRIRQILNSLITNAIENTDQGEVVVRLSALDLVNGKQTFRCDVQDTGSGISPEMQFAMYEAFSSDQAKPSSNSGLGLGLAIAHELVSMYDGEISFRSRVGEGTRFTFTVKLDTVADDAGGLNQRRPLRGAKVLVVDDNEATRSILYNQLSGWGMRPQVVDSGSMALEKLAEATAGSDPFIVQVLDYRMPEMNGIQLMQAVQRDESIAPVKTLMLQSSEPDMSAKELAEIGIDRCITKPARQSLLHDTLCSLMPRISDDKEMTAGFSSNKVPTDTRVLLAEDNKANQEVAENMLAELGCVVSVARNGAEAVELATQKPFDIIMMDCVMPVMDGFEALSEIRNLEVNATTPVIALTASALQGDRENCLDRGMTDYLGKPIRQIQLLNVLKRWVEPNENRGALSAGEAGKPLVTSGDAAGGSRTKLLSADADDVRSALQHGGPDHDLGEPDNSDTAAQQPAQSAVVAIHDQPAGIDAGEAVDASAADTDEAGVSLINNKAIDVIRSLQRPGKPDLLSKVVQVFCERTPATISEMQQALEERDYSSIKDNAHSLKSSSAYLGADGMSKNCKRIETSINSGNHDELPELIESIASDYELVQAELGAVLSKAA